jgi:hypothetical protein
MAIQVPDQSPIRVSYSVGATPQDTFTWPKRIFTADDVKVYVDEDPTPVTFTTSGTIPNENGCDIILDTPVSNAVVVIAGDIPVQRTTNFPLTGPFPIDTLNRQLNEIFAILQEQETGIARALAAADASDADFSDLSLPNPVDGEFPVWSGTTGLMVNSGINITTFAADVLAAAASAAAAAVSEGNAAASEAAAAVSEANAAASAALALAAIWEWQGSWLTATAYEVNDVVEEGGSSYICLVNHTSGVFATDLGNSYWQLVAQKGADANSAVPTAYTGQQYFAEATLVDAASIAWDLDTQQTAAVTLGGNRTLSNPTNMQAGGTYILRVIQDGIGSRTLAFDTAYKFPGGSAPVLSTGIGAIDILTFYSDGTNMNCVAQLDFS